MLLRNPIRRQGTYYNRILGLFGSSILAYWPLDEAAGLTAIDHSGNSHNGTYSGPTLGSPGIEAGSTCPSFDGVNDYIDLYTAGLAAAVNGAEGSVLYWFKPSSINIWTDGVLRRLFEMPADVNNYLETRRSSVNNSLIWTYVGGGVSKGTTPAITASADWFSFAFTWSRAADQLKCYVNGVQNGPTVNAVPVWVGAPYAIRFTLNVATWSGYAAHIIVLNRPATEAEVVQFARR